MLEAKFQTEHDRDFDAVECLRWAFCTEPCSGGGGWERRDIFNSSGRLLEQRGPAPYFPGEALGQQAVKSSVPAPMLRWRGWRRGERRGVWRHSLLPRLTHRHERSCTEPVPSGGGELAGRQGGTWRSLGAWPRGPHADLHGGWWPEGRREAPDTSARRGSGACEAKDRMGPVRNKTSLSGDRWRMAGGLYSCGR